MRTTGLGRRDEVSLRTSHTKGTGTHGWGATWGSMWGSRHSGTSVRGQGDASCLLQPGLSSQVSALGSLAASQTTGPSLFSGVWLCRAKESGTWRWSRKCRRAVTMKLAFQHPSSDRVPPASCCGAHPPLSAFTTQTFAKICQWTDQTENLPLCHSREAQLPEPGNGVNSNGCRSTVCEGLGNKGEAGGRGHFSLKLQSPPHSKHTLPHGAHF